jgi:uncharacterized membrane protein
VAGTRSVSALSSQVSSYTTSDDVRADETQTSDPRLSKRAIVVQTSVEVPFSASVAFDAFSDFPRQAEFSPWLRKVEYLNLNPGTNMGETKWTMGYMGIVFSWNAFVTRIEYPNILEWKSTTGMPNFGRVDFSPVNDNDNRTNVTMTMTFVAPRLVAALFRRSSTLANTVQNQIIRTTLINFRDAVQKDQSQ